MEDVQRFVNHFYEQARRDDLLGDIFENAIRDWSHHLPTMYAFWSSLLLGTMDYHGSPFPKHLALPVEKIHFERWVHLFWDTIDSLFVGPKADEAKDRAFAIASTFEYKIRKMRESAF